MEGTAGRVPNLHEQVERERRKFIKKSAMKKRQQLTTNRKMTKNAWPQRGLKADEGERVRKSGLTTIE
jgi:glutamate/tyrosine decarboxylase-like PLP-dependent enzyme